MNPTPILHHFEASPFSEKLRAIFGFKRMAWRSVLIPMAMPKPDVIALTGGHRRTPIFQIGADVYCDSALIAQVIEALHPEPPLLHGQAPMAPMVAAWADSTLFWQAVMNTQSPDARARIFEGMTPEAMAQVRQDRTAFTSGLKRPSATDAAAQMQSALRRFEQTLNTSPWLMGQAASIADFSVYHCLWFMVRAGLADTLLGPWPAVQAWLARIAAMGHGTRTEMSSAEAIALAASSGGHAPVQVAAGLGFDAGDSVTVAALDYGTEGVTGTLVGLDVERVTLARRDERAGLVHVHFPRLGFDLRRAA
jgi:glutathione S-transferase